MATHRGTMHTTCPRPANYTWQLAGWWHMPGNPSPYAYYRRGGGFLDRPGVWWGWGRGCSDSCLLLSTILSGDFENTGPR